MLFKFFATQSRCFRLPLCVGAVWLAVPSSAPAVQIDIQGPPGSHQFGSAIAVLPNGNIVVTDPYATVAAAEAAGAVYVYTANGALISTLTGSSTSDNVGNGGIVVLPSGNFVVLSPNWSNSAATSAGAATWMNGTTGLTGVVSATNSLVGSSANDLIGEWGAAVVGDGNYVVISPDWSNGAATATGAVTWANGQTGTTGTVSPGNSLVGSSAYDHVGNRGVAALTNGNYVVASPDWSDGAKAAVGAVTWANGATGMAGAVSTDNSMVGTKANDSLGFSFVTALTNGNYIVASPKWSSDTTNYVGAVTWRDGTVPASGTVTASNSLVGTQENDDVGIGAGWYIDIGVVALGNGNYVVRSSNWNNGNAEDAGAVTWCDGSHVTVGTVSASNSLVGTTAGDHIGVNGVTALTNGNYVVASHYWAREGEAFAGAATWGSGTTGISGPVSESNSLVGTGGDQVGYGGVVALSNGNYVVSSFEWAGTLGAVTWGDGGTGVVGEVSAGNSIVGSTYFDHVGGLLTPLANGNYVFASPNWSSETTGDIGAAIWVSGTHASSGYVSPANSLTGRIVGDMVGLDGFAAFSDGAFAVLSSSWRSPPDCSGAVTVASGNFHLAGVPQASNSVFCGITSLTVRKAVAYDAGRRRVAIGRPGSNAVSLLTLDDLFANDFE